MEEKNSPFSFVSLSAFIHGSVLLAIAALPALKMLPETGSGAVEIVTEAGMGSLPRLPEAMRETEIKPQLQSTAAPTRPPKKLVTKTAAKAPTEPTESVDAAVIAAQSAAEKFAREQAEQLKPLELSPAQPSDDPDQQVINETATSAAAQAVAQQTANETAEELPAPKINPAVERLGDIQSDEHIAAGDSGHDLGAVAGPSADELRSYLELRQMGGNVPPQYPTNARRNGWQGEVVLHYFVTSTGQVKDVRLARSSGFPELDQAAIQAVSKYRYVAGQEGWTSHPVVFSLKGQAKPAASRLRTAGQTSAGKND